MGQGPELAELSDYLLASRARELVDSVGPRLAAAGVRLAEKGIAADWASFVETVEAALRELEARQLSDVSS